MWWFLLFGCEGVTNLCDATGLCYEEQVAPSKDVLYAGTVSQGPVAEGVPLVEEGSLTFTDPATGDFLAEGTQPYRSDPGFWEAALPRKAEFQLRIESPEAYPTVWRGRAPPQQGWWYTGAIFSWPHSVWDSFSDALEAQGMGPFPDLQAEERVALWGAPVDENLEVMPLGPGRVSVVDGAGQLAEILLVGAEEVPEGELVPTFFLAFDLAPGDITVLVSGESGDMVETHYTAQGGDVISAWWFEVPE